jgi:hypothetical protein
MNQREHMIQSAIQDFESGVYPSIRAAAKAYNVSRATVGRRIQGRPTRHDAHEYRQRLSRVQEEVLVEWILDLDSLGYPPSHARTREMACRILCLNGDTDKLGSHWLDSFIRRNSRVATCIGRPIEALRIQCTDPATINAFFEHFEHVKSTHNVQTRNIYNMDETGIGLGICTNTRVLAEAGKSRTYVQSPQNREWVSIVETVSADGRSLQPLIIFKGKDLQSTWFSHDSIPDWLYTTSENGWTSNDIAIRWLNRIFLPQTACGDEARILLLDGHGSHVSIDFLWQCRQSNIQLIFLPPHTSHVLQPLDLSCFSPIKSRYRSQIAELAYLDDSAPVKKNRFVQCYNSARQEGLTERVIRSGWKAAGICPWNPSKVLLSSQVRSRPKTPPRKPILDQSNINPLLITPRKPQQLHLIAQCLQKSQQLSREVRVVFQKTRKVIAELNARQAASDMIIQRQQLGLPNGYG